MCKEYGEGLNPHMAKQMYDRFRTRDGTELVPVKDVVDDMMPVFYNDEVAAEFTTGAMGITKAGTLEFVKVGNIIRGLETLLEE